MLAYKSKLGVKALKSKDDVLAMTERRSIHLFYDTPNFAIDENTRVVDGSVCWYLKDSIA